MTTVVYQFYFGNAQPQTQTQSSNSSSSKPKPNKVKKKRKSTSRSGLKSTISGVTFMLKKIEEKIQQSTSVEDKAKEIERKNELALRLRKAEADDAMKNS